MALTPGGLPYPLGTDKVVDGDDAIHNLALALDPLYLQATEPGGVQGAVCQPVKAPLAHLVLSPGLWLIEAGGGVAIDGTLGPVAMSVFIVGANTELNPPLRSPAYQPSTLAAINHMTIRAAIVTITAQTDVQVVALPATAQSQLRFSAAAGGPSAWITALRIRS